MILPIFDPGNDPGPSFVALLNRVADLFDDASDAAVRGMGIANHLGVMGVSNSEKVMTGDVRHGTTCLAVRYRDGVLLAGDRRATAGNYISSHRMEKVFRTDNHSGVAISGVAGPAVEMVRLFRLQLEHYEKVEGTPLSLEGKANQLSQMVRGNLPAAMRGLPVIPIFAGFDLNNETGLIFEYDITGGCYGECDYTAAGSGSMHARAVLKLESNSRQTRAKATDLALKALLIAADADSATGGPDLLRSIFPVMAVINADGYQLIGDEELNDRSSRLIGVIAESRVEDRDIQHSSDLESAS